MRKKIITMAVTLLLLGLLSAVEQMAVKRLTDDAMARTQEILSLLAQNQTARGLEQAHEMDAWWDEEAPRVETLINHEATDDVRFTLSRLVAALEMGDRDGAFVYARELEGGIEHVLERQTLSWAEFAVKRRAESVFASAEACKASKIYSRGKFYAISYMQ